MFILETYSLYLVISIAVTIWVARTLHKNGRAFLIDAFQGNDTIADSVNHLLVAGFYLLNVGWIVVTLRTQQEVNTGRALMELLSDKVGLVLLVLGVLHFCNLIAFSRMRRSALDRRPNAPPPLRPSSVRQSQERPI